MTTRCPSVRGTYEIRGRARLALDADVETLPDDPARLKLLIGELQFEVGLLNGIIAQGGGAHNLLRRGDRC